MRPSHLTLSYQTMTHDGYVNDLYAIAIKDNSKVIVRSIDVKHEKQQRFDRLKRQPPQP